MNNKIYHLETFGKKHIEEWVRGDEQAFKAAEFLAKSFPKKYKSKIIKHNGFMYLQVNHVKNGFGVHYQYNACRYN